MEKSKYSIQYSRGGATEYVEAKSPLEAIQKGAKKSLSKTKTRFFETNPATDLNHFIVTSMSDETVAYFQMIAG